MDRVEGLEIGHRAEAVAGRRAGGGGACSAPLALSPALEEKPLALSEDEAETERRRVVVPSE
jgi:hypothetical protein